jgi:hypothetical protein
MLINLSLYDFTKNESNTSHTCEKNRAGMRPKNQPNSGGNRAEAVEEEQEQASGNNAATVAAQARGAAGRQTHSRRKARRSKRPVGGIPCLEPNCR